MLLPKPAGTGTARLALRSALRPAARSLSTTAARSATPTAGKPSYGPNDPRGGIPVDDIDVVFDYPSEGQTAHQKQPLEASGLDIHSAMPHHPKGGTKAGMQQAMGKRFDKEMGRPSNNMMYVPYSARYDHDGCEPFVFANLA